MRRRGLFLPAQCRAARGLLAWSRERLAAVSGLELEAIELFEAGDGELSELELVRLGDSFNTAGVIALAEKLGGLGVRFAQPSEPGPARSRPPPDF